MAPPITQRGMPAPAATDVAVPQQWQHGVVPTPTGTSTLAALKRADVRVQVDQNHRKWGASGTRFAQYRSAGTMDELTRLGATNDDLYHDIRRGIITFPDTAVADALEGYLADSERLEMWWDLCSLGDDVWSAYGADSDSALVNMQPLPSHAYVRYTLSSSLPSTIAAALEAVSDVRFVDAAEMRPAPNRRRDRAPPSVAAAPASMAADAGARCGLAAADAVDDCGSWGFLPAAAGHDIASQCRGRSAGAGDACRSR